MGLQLEVCGVFNERIVLQHVVQNDDVEIVRRCRSQRRRSQWLPPGANHASGQPCTVFGQTLGLESDGTEELRMQWCVSAPPKFMNTLLVKFHTVLHPELSKGPLVRNTRWMIGGLLPLETRTFVLSVPVLEGIRGQQNVYVPPCRRSGQDRQGFLEG